MDQSEPSDSEFTECIGECQTACDTFDKDLLELVRHDSYLCDLIGKQDVSIEDNDSQLTVKDLPTNEDVSNAIALQFGQAMRLILLRGDGARISIIIPITAQVLDLYRAVELALINYLKLTNVLPDSDNPPKDPTVRYPIKHIHWRSYWRSKCLAVINPLNNLPPQGFPTIVCRLDVLENKLKEDCHVNNGMMITIIRRLKRK